MIKKLIFSYAKDKDLNDTIRLLEEFISDSQNRLAMDDPDYHSFDEEDDANWNQNGRRISTKKFNHIVNF